MAAVIIRVARRCVGFERVVEPVVDPVAAEVEARRRRHVAELRRAGVDETLAGDLTAAWYGRSAA